MLITKSDKHKIENYRMVKNLTKLCFFYCFEFISLFQNIIKQNEQISSCGFGRKRHS